MNNQFHDNENNYLDSAMLLAGMAARHASEVRAHSILDRAPSGAILTDPALDEAVIMDLAWAALCKSRGVPESENDQISWVLYCRGALEGAVFDYELQGFSASYAWPEQQFALMLTTTLSDSEQFAAEELAECAYVEAVFQQNGWIVVRIDPDSPTVEDQLERIATVVRALKDDGNRAA